MNFRSKKIRAKLPPEMIATATQALNAFDMMHRYRSMADGAFDRYMAYTSGTRSANQHYERYEAYADVADMWHLVLRKWLVNEAIDGEAWKHAMRQGANKGARHG